MGQKENIEIAQIEKELSALWDSKPQGNKMKACLFNLVIYTQNSERVAYFKEIVHMVMEAFPCRIIFIAGNPSGSSPSLKVDVATQGGMNGKTMACDQILVEAMGEEKIDTVPFIILPHFIPDLPIYLIWGEDPTEDNTLLTQLQQYATRLIIDSEAVDDLQQFSQAMLVRLGTKKEIMDMNWTRTTGWREVLAQTFDSPKRIQQLASARFMRIVYNNNPSPYFRQPDTQAIYLQAWLASSLGWIFQSRYTQENDIVLNYTYSNHPIQVTLAPQKNIQIATEEILEIEVSDQENYFCSLSRKSQDLVVVHSSTQYECELPFTITLPTLTSGRIFMQEVFYQKTSEHYIQMLELISKASWR